MDSTITRAFSVLADIENVADEDWVEKGKNGETVEANMEDLIFHQPLVRQGASTMKSPDDIKNWFKIYTDRNKKWAATDWKNEK